MEVFDGERYAISRDAGGGGGGEARDNEKCGQIIEGVCAMGEHLMTGEVGTRTVSYRHTLLTFR